MVQYSLNAGDRAIRHERKFDAVNTVDLDAVVNGARRQWKVLVLSIAASLLLSFIYFTMATKMYTGTTKLLIDAHIFPTLSPSDEQAALVLTGTSLDSQVEVLKSQKIALSVINKLDLFNDPEFVAPSFFSRIVRIVRIKRAQTPEEKKAEEEARALDRFANRTTITRTNKTLVLEIDFDSEDQKKAATIANAIAAAYISDEVDSRTAAATRATDWMRDRIVELKQKTADADLAVAQYREKNSLITANGRLINDQQLTDLNAQLSEARNEVARIQAKYDHILSAVAARDTGATASAELSSPVITRLRDLYFTVAKQRDDIVQRVGPDHIQVRNLENQMRTYENQILEELGRIAESARSDVEVAKQRERSLSANLAKLIASAANDNRTAVDLRQRQQSADAYQALYGKSLEHFEDLLRQQTFSMSATRVIEEAQPLGPPSQPKPVLVLAIGLFAGLTVGTGAAMYREYRDRTFRLTDQIRSELDLSPLGVLPLQSWETIDAHVSSNRVHDTDVLPGVPPTLKICAIEPFSRYADTMRAIKVAIDSRRDVGPAKIIAVTSTVEGEGKSVTSTNFAVFCASTGARTLLIDADLRRCHLSRELAPEGVFSLASVIRGEAQTDQALTRLSDMFWFLTAGNARETANSSELLRSEGMKRLLATMADQFDYIIVDMPPLLAMVDGRAIEPLVDYFIYVIEWGKIERQIVRNTLTEHPTLYKKCIGAVLNKVNQVLISRYTSGTVHGYQ